MKLLIIGNSRAGKDTASEYIADKYNLRYIPTSLFIAKKVIAPLAGGNYYDLYKDRHSEGNRLYWADAIGIYNSDSSTRIIKEVFEISDIYCGLRSKKEFDKAKEEKLFDLSIWIDRSDFETSFYGIDELTKSCADIIIENNLEVTDLYQKIDNLFSAFSRP